MIFMNDDNDGKQIGSRSFQISILLPLIGVLIKKVLGKISAPCFLH